jgi:hypothetical protein
MGDRGRLQEPPARLTGGFSATEKIDGTNARIILTAQGYFLGSREELLHFRGDVIHNPALGIVEGIRPTAERAMAALAPEDETLLVLWGEFYGGKTTAAAREYAREGSVGYRLFDAARIDPAALEGRSPAEIATWREAGGQAFAADAELDELATAAEAGRVPALFRFTGEDFPTGMAGILALLERELPQSSAVLDEGSGARPEGIVIRNAGRSAIFKLRFEDYRRSLRAAR